MRERIDHDIDAHWECFFERELAVVGFLFALAFPAVSQIGIVTQDGHQSSVVVEQSAKVNLLGVGPFPSDAEIRTGSQARGPQIDVWYLRLFFQVKQTVKNRMVQRSSRGSYFSSGKTRLISRYKFFHSISPQKI